MRTEQKSYQGFWKDDSAEDGKMRTENDGKDHDVKEDDSEEDDGDTTKCTFT